MLCSHLQMRQNSSGQIRPLVPNGPSVNSTLPAHRSPVVQPPCSAQPLTNGPVPPGPRPPSVCNNHVSGARANGDVPYLHPTALPHNCTSPRQLWKSQHLNSTQVNTSTTHASDSPVHLTRFTSSVKFLRHIANEKCLVFPIGRGFRKVQVCIGRVLMETGLSLPPLRPKVALTIRLDILPRPPAIPRSQLSIICPPLPPRRHPLPPLRTRLPQVRHPAPP